MAIERIIPAGIFLLKVNNRNTRKRCEICSKLTIKALERRRCRRHEVFIVNFEQIFTHIFVVQKVNMHLIWGNLCTSVFPNYITLIAATFFESESSLTQKQ